MKLKSLILFSFFGLSFLLAPTFLPVQATAITSDDAYGGLDKVLNEADKKGSAGTVLRSISNPEDKITSIIGTVLSFVGVAFLILMIYGGILWMTSQGNNDQIKKAKGILINGIIGLVIVIFAYAITAYIGNTLTNSSTSSGQTSITP